MVDAGVIFSTLERAGERDADPTRKVYDRLFELYPECRPLFVMDVDGSVRGSMFAQSVECLLGVVDEDPTQRLLLPIMRNDHEGYGVPPERFSLMFTAMRDTFRELLGSEWSAREDAEWEKMLSLLETLS